MTRLFVREELIAIKLKSLRKRVWFRVLNECERALINLSIRVVDVVRSEKLAKVLSIAVEKLRKTMRSLMDRAKEVGQPLAEKLSMVAAQAWGNLEAWDWANDKFYAIYLGLSILNRPVGLYP